MAIPTQPASLILQSTELLASLLDSSPQAMAYFEVIAQADGSPADFRLVLANRAAMNWLAMAGYVRAGSTFTSLHPWATETGWLGELLQVFESSQPAQRDLRHPAVGQWLRVSARPLANGIVLDYSDITELKQHGTTLRKAELVQSVLDETPAGMIASEAIRGVDGQITDLLFVHVNRQVERLLGLTPAQLIDKLNSDVFPESMVNGIFDRYVEVIESGSPQVFDCEYRADGVDGWYRVTARRLNDGLVVSFLDITTLKEAEAIYAQQTDLLQMVLDNAPAGMVLWEAVRDTTAERTIIDFRFRLANRMNAFLMGHSDSSPVGKRLLKQFPRFENSALVTALHEVFASRRATGMIFSDYGAQPGGWFDSQLIPVGNEVLMICLNVTEQHTSQRTQKEMADLMQAIVVNSPVGLALLSPQHNAEGDFLDFTYRLANDTLAALSGRTPAQLIGKQLLELFPGLQDSDYYRGIMHVMQTGEPRRVTIPYYQDGAAGWFDNLLIRQGDDLLLCVTDVTERQNHQQQLELLNGALQQSNENLQQFAFIASHDLQEPLRKVQSFGTLLRTQYASQLNDAGVDLIRRMEASALRMSVLIRDLLEFSRLSTRQEPTKAISLNKLMANVVTDLDLVIRETGAKVIIDPLPTLPGDLSQLTQLFQNLLTNALKFHQPGSTPVIRLSHRKVSANTLAPNPLFPFLTVGDTSAGSPRLFHEISIADNGIGFDTKYTDRIFGVFQRLHGRTQFPGSGIGLSICKKVAENHGGAISVDSTPGQGTTFRVYLPV
ncbi:PAS domain-containing sensor histidine kinase [Fibrella aquatilis]|uniref:histidine kinase n=1 Tax=Fibrella aquatilis TaxID=2817059 RepID=A0A939G6A8_9BACT|nr:PAS domain-containing protein [Fibrella aquatilis]MBO0930831.1 PAS domain-containing protein [Fibrella aquatilis]